MLFYIILVCSCLLLFIYRYSAKKHNTLSSFKEIPTEQGLPIVGVLNKVENSLTNYLVKLGRKHGPIYRIKFGMRDIVVLNTFEYIKAAFVDHGVTLSGRWKGLNYLMVSNGMGIIYSDGDIWAHHKNFISKTLKDFGMGRSRSMEIVQDECLCLLKDLESLESKCVDFSHFIPMYTANIISKFIMNKRFTHDDPELHVIEKVVGVIGNKKDILCLVFLMFPFLDRNEWLMRFITWITSRKSLFDDCHNIFEREIKKHLQELDFNSEGDDLMDRFLIEQHRLKKKNGEVGSFTDWQLVKHSLELLMAGYDTSAVTLTWSFMFMATNPEMQNKVHEEIIDKIGNERLPTMEDKMFLHYTQAVMDEIMRLSSIVPLSVVHRPLNDVYVKGYFIPKDTLVMSNLFACHLDPNVWEKPLEFHPEHFLLTDNDGSVKYKPREELIPFSIGKRQCLGESLARMEYFIFFTSILQRFRVSLGKEVKNEFIFDVFHSGDGLIRLPTLTEFIFKRYERHEDDRI